MPFRAQARINLAAIQRNAATLHRRLSGGAALCAVVKAEASGHGAVPAARAALAGGARRLAVATAGEAAQLRAAGLEAPLLVMGALSGEELDVALEARAELVAWTESFVDRVAGRAGSPVSLHVKLDTGMGRLGTRETAEALAVAERIRSRGGALRLAGAMTHLASADCDPEFTAAQLGRFRPFVSELKALTPWLIAHAANSAATLNYPSSHFDMVRCGIALYGCDPMNADPDPHRLEPALELSSYVAAVKPVRPGESAGYGRRFIAERDTWVATLPIGYADGVRRGLSNNGEILIEGRRRPVVGTVSMDNVTVELGQDGGGTPVGTAAVIIGRQGDERLLVEDVATRLGTINHEVLCGLSTRVTRQYHRDGAQAD
jgi:alanine racemase